MARSAAVRRCRPLRPCGSDDDVAEFAAFLPRLFPAGSVDGCAHRWAPGVGAESRRETRAGGAGEGAAVLRGRGAGGAGAAGRFPRTAALSREAALCRAVLCRASPPLVPLRTLLQNSAKKLLCIFLSPPPPPPRMRIAANAFGRREYREGGGGLQTTRRAHTKFPSVCAGLQPCLLAGVGVRVRCSCLSPTLLLADLWHLLPLSVQLLRGRRGYAVAS